MKKMPLEPRNPTVLKIKGVHSLKIFRADVLLNNRHIRAAHSHI